VHIRSDGGGARAFEGSVLLKGAQPQAGRADPAAGHHAPHTLARHPKPSGGGCCALQ